MRKRDEVYKSYLLRLRLHQRDDRLRWLISLEEPRSGQLHTFRSLKAAVDFLRRQMKAVEVNDDVDEDDVTGRAAS
ncbi:MAG TPA: hypothetical protein VK879_05600 [Candidatus Sulfomarinibacteraceae bacterium]|nr:hypothetical protein [Candidatus Sulfomarinibacteraceae bacterium]